jgi:2-polyprenyl-6-methoxyphenol hydroxylase-like FAD-dependent oxidoreductase
MRRIGDHVVVLGASLAGLLAARVLADAYGRVTVVERDPVPETAENRKGVPQGRHAHLLLPRGAQILDGLFPGLLDDLVAGGAPVIRDLGELRFSPGGHRLRLEGHPPEAITYQASRPYLEGQVRARVRALPTVEVVDRCEVVGLVAIAGWTAGGEKTRRLSTNACMVEPTMSANQAVVNRAAPRSLVLEASAKGPNNPTVTTP